MKSKTLERLEFERVKEIIRGYLLSPPGIEALSNLVPEMGFYEVQENYRLLEKLEGYLKKGTRFNFSAFPDIKKSVTKASTGAPLTFKEIREVGEFILSYIKLYEIIGLDFSFLTNPETLKPLQRSIFEIIDEDGDVRSDATPELARLRKKVLSLRGEIYSILSDFIKRFSQTGVLREPVITIRNGRFVIPVIANFKVDGIIHGYSKTSETVFVEPMEVVSLQNSYIKACEEEKEELERIQREFSERIGKLSDLLLTVWDEVGKTELIYALALFKGDFNCCIPEFSDRFIEIIGGYHPVLVSFKGFDGVVPLDIHVDKKVFLVSGPNAGGKTVLLKTVGLFHLMAKAGIPIPAEKAVLLFPEEVIGVGFQDEQDIVEGESSFTSYIKEIAFVLENAKEGYLVLFDELISSTDPQEASGIAYAVLEELLQRGVWVFANTHLTPLKLLVSSNSEMLNASMEFDPVNLKPTYKVRVGEIGVSHAFEIAEKNGIPPRLIDRARECTQGEGALLEKVLNSLREKEVLFTRLTKEYDEKLRELNDKVSRAEKIAKERALKIVEEAREAVDQILKEVRREESLEKRKVVVKEARKELADLAQNYELALKPVDNPQINKEYFIKPIGITGILKEVRKDKVLMQVGKTLMEVPVSYLYELG